MKKIWLVAALAALTARLCATSYYVSQSSGSDANAGTSTAAPWKTLAKVNAATLAAGDAVYLKRGDVWREQLVPPSSGTSGNPIAFDAYGTGAAPVITAELDLSSNTWTYVSGSVWQSTLSSTLASPVINYVRFGTVYGQLKSGTCASMVTNPREFCVTWPTLYVYAPAGTSPAAYYASVAPVVGTGAGLNLIYVSSKKWLTFQHIKVQTFDYVGVGLQARRTAWCSRTWNRMAWCRVGRRRMGSTSMRVRRRRALPSITMTRI